MKIFQAEKVDGRDGKDIWGTIIIFWELLVLLLQGS